MAKQKLKNPCGTSLLKHKKKKYLKNKFPFLKQEFRKLEAKELKSKEVFKELFGEVPFVDGWLKAIYFYQN